MNTIYLVVIVTLVLFLPSSCELLCLEGCSCEENHASKRLGSHFMIDCSDLGLSSVPRDLNKFQNYGTPIHLSLQKNNIVRVSKADFPENLPIIALDFNHNRAVIITSDAFENIKDLVHIGLEDTSLRFTDTMTYLTGMTNLRYLYLGKNYQFGEGDVPKALFKDLKLSLIDLKFNECYLKGMDPGALANVMIRNKLDLSANILDHIPEEVKILKNLTELDISQNSIKIIPRDTFKGMSSLMILSLSNNYISENSFKDGCFNGLNLRELRFERCELNTVPSNVIAPMSSLKVLKLANSPIKSIPIGSFNGSYCLEVLDLANILAEVENVHLDGLETCLKRLYLDNMQIRKFPHFLKNFKELEYVSLSGNSIKQLKKGDLVGTSIKQLDLTKNPLQIIEKGALEPFPSSISLQLSDTQLSNLSFVHNYEYGTVRYIDMGTVTPKCDCELAFIEYRVLNLHGNCVMNMSETIDVTSSKFIEITSHCWPDGKMPAKKDVWGKTDSSATDGGNGASLVSYTIVNYFIVLLPLKFMYSV